MASVSRALNGTGVVTESIRTRVLEAAARLQYVPNSGAQSLMTRRTHTIGIVLPTLYGEFFSELIRGIDVAARARGLHLLISSTHCDADRSWQRPAVAHRSRRRPARDVALRERPLPAGARAQLVADRADQHRRCRSHAYILLRGQLQQRLRDGRAPRRLRSSHDRAHRRSGRERRCAGAPARLSHGVESRAARAPPSTFCAGISPKSRAIAPGASCS